MIKQEQNKALAELDGNWIVIESDYGGMIHWKDYPNSRDAIVPVLLKQPSSIKVKVGEILRKWLKLSADDFFVFDCITLTPAQICEVLLRATGKWKE